MLLDANDPNFVFVATNVYGHFVSHDGGQSFGWICSDLFAAGLVDTHPIVDAVVAGTASRIVLVAGSAGLFRTETDGCDWNRIELSNNPTILGVAVDDDAPDTVWLATRGGLFRSQDAGADFEPIVMNETERFDDVTVDATGRVWVSAFDNELEESSLRRSDDRGETFTTTSLAETGVSPLAIVAVTSTEVVTTVLLRAIDPGQDRLWRHDEATASTERVLDPQTRLHEVRRQDDGRLSIGGSDGRTWGSADDGRTWTVQSESPGQLCYARQGATDYACARQREDRAAVVVERQDGSWEPFFVYEQTTGPLACLGPDEATTCTVGDRFLGQCFEFDEFGVDTQAIEACPALPTFGDTTAGSSGGSGSDDHGGAAAESQGCACRSTPGKGTTWPLLAIVLAGYRRRVPSPRR